jgi:hypothetical protein
VEHDSAPRETEKRGRSGGHGKRSQDTSFVENGPNQCVTLVIQNVETVERFTTDVFRLGDDGAIQLIKGKGLFIGRIRADKETLEDHRDGEKSSR